MTVTNQKLKVVHLYIHSQISVTVQSEAAPMHMVKCIAVPGINEVVTTVTAMAVLAAVMPKEESKEAQARRDHAC